MHIQNQLQLNGTCNLSSYMIIAEYPANIAYTVTKNSSHLLISGISIHIFEEFDCVIMVSGQLWGSYI